MLRSMEAVRGGIFLKLGFRHTAFQAVCTVIVLCFALVLLQRGDTNAVFGEQNGVRLPILLSLIHI